MIKLHIYPKQVLIICALLLANQLKPQMSVVYSQHAEITKDIKQGRFAGTYVKPDGSAELFFLTANGPYGYNF